MAERITSAAREESSVMTSLGALLSLEQNRINEEHERALQRAAQVLADQKREVERLEQVDQTRRDAEARAAREDDARRRDEQARLDGIKNAELERARIEVETHAAAEIAERLRTESVERPRTLRTGKLLLTSFVGGGVLVALVLGAFRLDAALQEIGDLKRDMGDLVARVDDQQAASARSTSDLVARLDDLRRERPEPGTAAAIAGSMATSPSLAPSSTAQGTHSHPNPPRVTAPGSRRTAACPCDEHDPLCPCLP